MATTKGDPWQVVQALRELVAEEMHLLGLEVESALDGAQLNRREELTEALDEANRLLSRHRLGTGQDLATIANEDATTAG